jgi:hypothetical protein
MSESGITQHEIDELVRRNDSQAVQLAAFDDCMREAGRLYGLSWDFIGSDPAHAMLHAFKMLYERKTESITKEDIDAREVAMESTIAQIESLAERIQVLERMKIVPRVESLEFAQRNNETVHAELQKRIAALESPCNWDNFKKAYAPRTEATAMKTLAPHQKRVVTERAELLDKCEKLSMFIFGPIYSSLAVTEQSRLSRQLDAMKLYLAILDERIEAF